MNTAHHFDTHRHLEGACRPGLWLQNISLMLNGGERGDWHIHAHCVVDDYGTLQPVAFSGMTVTNQVVRSVA